MPFVNMPLFKDTPVAPAVAAPPERPAQAVDDSTRQGLHKVLGDASAFAAARQPALPGGLPFEPHDLHPSLWRGHQLAGQGASTVPSGFPELDAQLPGGGWPRGVLTELLLPSPGIGEIRLLSVCLAALQRAGRLVMLFDPPSGLSAKALTQLGLDLQTLLIVNTRARVIPGTDSLWAMEQALKSGHVGALVGWLPPRLRAERLRRLQLAAHAHGGPAFVLREIAAAQRPSSAPLRLGLQAAGADVLAVRVVKRRGPPLEAPIRLALPAVLSLKAQGRAAVGAAQARGRSENRARGREVPQRSLV